MDRVSRVREEQKQAARKRAGDKREGERIQEERRTFCMPTSGGGVLHFSFGHFQ